MKKRVVLGIDTSNYTTSVSIIDLDGALIANLKRPLPVKQGEHGLRQSDAVFAHVKNLPDIMEEARGYLEDCECVAVGVSERPRNIDGSYMPCFLSGLASAESISATLGVPIYRFSHQCGHIMAALYSSGRFDLLDKEFCAFHVSGGTTEVLRVSPDGYAFKAQLVGGTLDLNAGQVIDRIGVKMGFAFPCGKHLEEAAKNNTLPLPTSRPRVVDLGVNLSGLENMAENLYHKSKSKELTSAFVLKYVSSALIKLADAYVDKYGKVDFVFAGGVMSNSLIKADILKKHSASFAEPQLSADNAVGIAYLALRKYNSEK